MSVPEVPFPVLTMTDKLQLMLSTTLAFDRLTKREPDDTVLSPEQVECLVNHLRIFGDVLSRTELLRYLRGLALSHENLRITKLLEEL